MSLSQKVKLLRTQRGWTQRELADRVGTSSAAISKIETGDQKHTSGRVIIGLAKNFGVDPDDLLNDKISAPALLTKLEEESAGKKVGDLDTVPPEDLQDISVLARVPCGMPAEIPKELIVGRIMLPLAWVKDKEAFAVVAEGATMTGFGIREGDHVVVSRKVEVQNGSVALVELRSQVVVRKVFYQGDQTLLQSGHPNSTPVLVTTEDGFRIVGKVVGNWSNPDEK